MVVVLCLEVVEMLAGSLDILAVISWNHSGTAHVERERKHNNDNEYNVPQGRSYG